MSYFKVMRSALLLLPAFLVLVSCDSNVKASKEVVTQAISHINSENVSALYEVYPRICAVGTLCRVLPGQFKVKKIRDSVYLVDCNNSKKQAFVVSFEGGKGTVIDSYGIALLTDFKKQLIEKTGIPDGISDMELENLSTDNKEAEWGVDSFFAFLRKDKGSPIRLNGNLKTYPYHGVITGSQFSISLVNRSSEKIRGRDYYIEITPRWYGVSDRVIKVDGVTLGPKGKGTTSDWTNIGNAGAYFRRTYEMKNFSWGLDAHFYNMTDLEALLKYREFDGTEYQEYLKYVARTREGMQ